MIPIDASEFERTAQVTVIEEREVSLDDIRPSAGTACWSRPPSPRTG